MLNRDFTHIDDWLYEPATDETQRLVKEWLEHYRRPAVDIDQVWLNARIITCVYEGKPYRCIGASRLGDIWLTADQTKENGYDLRIDVTKCSDWRVVLKESP
jgi:hypothetical protein